jgi:Zn-dependent protease with chaperone function
MFVDVDSLNVYNIEEWKFIIAHECGHILYNHSLSTSIILIPDLAAKLLSIVEKDQIYVMAYGLLKFLIPTLLSGRITTIDKEVIRNNELVADNFAINYTGDPDTAISVLNKLGGNLDMPSHYFSFLDDKYIALTLLERIDKIRKDFC